jgi:hypothetical protein
MQPNYLPMCMHQQAGYILKQLVSQYMYVSRLASLTFSDRELGTKRHAKATLIDYL